MTVPHISHAKELRPHFSAKLHDRPRVRKLYAGDTVPTNQNPAGAVEQRTSHRHPDEDGPQLATQGSDRI